MASFLEVFRMKMTFVAAAMAAAAGLSSSALADGRATITDATGGYNGSDGSGGAFTVTRASPLANGDYNGTYGGNRVSGDGRSDSNSFLSFCVEFNEHLSFGSTYYTEISTSAKDGGLTGGNPDPISATTAKLYSEFRSLVSNAASSSIDSTGKFNSLFGSTLDGAETTAIQWAIWYAEGERTLAEIGGNGFDTGSLAERVYAWARDNNDGTLGDVRVLRLWSGYSGGTYSGNSQDLLTIVPLPPAAWAGLGTMGCVLGISVIRRRKLSV
jgi:hypothetical protein